MSAPATDLAAPPTLEGTDGAPRPRVGWAYAGAGVLSAATLLALSNPALGVWMKAWPWAVHGARGWSRETATVFVMGACTLALFAGAFLAPGRVRAVGMLVPVWLGACFLTNTGTNTDPSGALPVKANLFGAAFFVGPLLAGTIAGGFWALLGFRRAAGRGARGVGRGVVILASALLMAILLYPAYQPPDIARWEDAPVYFSPLGDPVRLLFGGDAAVLFSRERLPLTGVTFLYAGLAVVGLAAAVFGPRRGLAFAGVSLFFATLAFPIVVRVHAGWNDPDYDPAWRLGLQQAAEQTFNLHMASALGLFACVADLIRGRSATAAPST